MKQLHEPNLWSWSLFNEERNLDFHSVFWCRSVARGAAAGSGAAASGAAAGNIVIDPLPLSAHDLEHVARLGGVKEIILTNSDHARAASALAAQLKAAGSAVRIWGPAQEPAFLAAVGAQPLRPEHELGAELEVIELEGSKTPGELCLILERTTLVTGDLIRGHRAGRLNLLPDGKLADKAQAIRSLERLARMEQLQAVLVGDGWPVFRAGAAALRELLGELQR